MSIITLTTDFGLKDHFVGALKGKILKELPNANLIDISHQIMPFNIAEASYIVSSSFESFPENTIHIIGVDSELHSNNKLIVANWKNQFFICADNGILSMVFQNENPTQLIEVVASENFKNSMDLFIDVGIKIFNGLSILKLGNQITNLKPIVDLRPIVNSDKNIIKGNVIYVDHFGNLVTNITKSFFNQIGQGRLFEIPLLENRNQRRTSPIKAIYEKYSDIAKNSNFDLKNFEGTKLAVFNERGFLEIAIYRSNPNVGSATTLLGIGYRDVIIVEFK
jgi:S-adenosylmethionine hydrolase